MGIFQGPQAIGFAEAIGPNARCYSLQGLQPLIDHPFKAFPGAIERRAQPQGHIPILGFRHLSAPGPQPVAHAINRFNEIPRSHQGQLAPHTFDVGFDGFFAGKIAHRPQVFEDSVAGKQPPGMAQKQFQEAVFLGAEVDGAIAIGHLTGARIQTQGAPFQHGRIGRSLATQQGPHPRHQFLDGARLDHIIISPGIQTLYLVFGFALGGQQQDGARILFPPQMATQTQAIQSRQGHIQNDQVIGKRSGVIQSLLPILSHIHYIELLRQGRAERVGNGWVIFN